MRVYHFQDAARIRRVHSVSDNKALLTDGANLAAFLYRLKADDWKCYDFIVQTIRLIDRLFSDFVLVPQEGNAGQIVLQWLQKGRAGILDASQLSDGTLRFACLVTLLMQPHELQPPILLIEEPELGLHPFAIVILGETIRTLPADRQVILSTQSSDLLDEFDVEDVVVGSVGRAGLCSGGWTEKRLHFGSKGTIPSASSERRTSWEADPEAEPTLIPLSHPVSGWLFSWGLGAREKRGCRGKENRKT